MRAGIIVSYDEIKSSGSIVDENNQEITFWDFEMEKFISGDEVYFNIEFKDLGLRAVEVIKKQVDEL